ncbi:MAG: RNA 2',3'-cyclic phosphodiesterase [Acidobacteria bacterium]|nr:RNA 2',3'-cyclic phosphodiesterase [Acidobacteriota bacterium]
MSKRIFVAVDISEPAREAVAEYMRGLHREFPGVRPRWLPPENLHITMRFVGNVDEAGLASVEKTVRDAADRFRPFSARLDGTGNFANRKIRQDALWIGVHSTPANALAELAAALAPTEVRKFVPHLTIARLKDPPKGRDLVTSHLNSKYPAVEFTVDHLTIYESILGPAGSTYVPFERVRLTWSDKP